MFFKIENESYTVTMYTHRPCVINHIWGRKQQQLQVNGHV